MTQQALKFYKEKILPPGAYEPFTAMIRVALTDTYADMADIPQNLISVVAKPAAAVHGIFSSAFGGLAGGTAQKAVGLNPYDEILGIASKAFNGVEHYALTHDQDDQPQMHAELHDDR
ncbi:hypothetical protein [Amycolatopsis sp. NPDC059021]|uniref:hypothetical protein n=1 Tax=Amycolatopsis sp. NPDC059021 TaxID=3346704 RepID=UPI00366BB72E